MGIFHVHAFAHGDGKPVYVNHHRRLLFFDEARGAWQIAAEIGPRATVAASARRQGATSQGPDDLCPDRAGAYYALRRNASASTGIKRRWVPGVTMACLDNIATHSGAGLGSEKGGDAEADGTVQPSEDGKGHVMEGLRGTRRAKVHCCASVKVHRVQKAGPEYPGAYTIDYAADAEDRVRLTGQYDMLFDRHTSTAAGEQGDRPIYRNLAKKRFLYYWAPFSAWRIGNDWEAATAIAASANGDRARCPSKISRLHMADASGGWNESALLSVTCSFKGQ